MYFYVHCNPLACDVESKASAIIGAHLDIVFLIEESLFPMMLVFFSAATSLGTLLSGVPSVASGAD